MKQLRDGRLVIGCYTDEHGLVRPLEVPKGEKVDRYAAGSYGSTPILHPAKLKQRQILADKMGTKGTVLEVYAGKGELTKAVYSEKADKVVMVDKNPKFLAEADQKLKVKREIILGDNVAWLKEAMNPAELTNLKLVDFDAYGSPAQTIKAFFDNYPITKNLLIALTDGSQIYVAYKQDAEGRRWLKENYDIDVLPGHFGKREDQIRILNEFMEAQGRKHDFKVEPISVAHGVHAVYAGYKITPKRNS
jgi:tRNA G26 N,N-dimethylase Trm1